MGKRSEEPAVVTSCVRYTQASVHAGRMPIRYKRAGAGAPVVAVGPSDDEWMLLCAALARRFRVIVPSVGDDDTGTDLGQLFRDLVDGLGLVRPHLVVAGARGVDALVLALSDPHRIDRLAILWHRSSECTALDWVLEDTLRDSHHALMLVPLQDAPACSLSEPLLEALISFLEGSGRSC